MNLLFPILLFFQARECSVAFYLVILRCCESVEASATMRRLTEQLIVPTH